MFNIGDEVYINNGQGSKGVIINKMQHDNRNDYLVKTDLCEVWQLEHTLKLASTISEVVLKFKDGDKVFLTEEHDLKNGKVIPKGAKGFIERTGEVIGSKLPFYLVDINGEICMCAENELGLDETSTSIGDCIRLIARNKNLKPSEVASELKKAIQDAPIQPAPAPTDYSIKSDQNKPQLSLVPIKQLWTAMARVREHSIEEYGDNDSWKKVELKRYHNALLRHCGEIDTDLNAIDKKSGLPHRWHIACNLAFIEALMEEQ